jgi:hypothetical protein
MTDLESKDIEQLRKWFFEKSVLWMPPVAPIEGERRILTAFRLIFRGYSDLHWNVGEIFSNNTTNGKLRYVYQTESWGTIGKTTPYKNSIMTLIEFDEQGRILFLSDYFKDTAIFNAGKNELPQRS